MKKSKFTEAQIIGILNEQSQQDQKVAEVCRRHGISEATFYNWRSKYAGPSVGDIIGATPKTVITNENAFGLSFGSKTSVMMASAETIPALAPRACRKRNAIIISNELARAQPTEVMM